MKQRKHEHLDYPKELYAGMELLSTEEAWFYRCNMISFFAKVNLNSLYVEIVSLETYIVSGLYMQHLPVMLHNKDYSDKDVLREGPYFWQNRTLTPIPEIDPMQYRHRLRSVLGVL